MLTHGTDRTKHIYGTVLLKGIEHAGMLDGTGTLFPHCLCAELCGHRLECLVPLISDLRVTETNEKFLSYAVLHSLCNKSRIAAPWLPNYEFKFWKRNKDVVPTLTYRHSDAIPLIPISL
jgi:hypothetical protein